MDADPDRRSFLKAGAIAGASAFAGCQGVPVIGGGSSSAAIGKYVAPPDEIGREDEHPTYRYAAPKAVEEHEDELKESVYDGYETRHEPLFDATGVDFDETDAQLSYGPAVVLRANYNKKEVGEDLEDENFDDDDEIGGFTTYDHDERSLAIGIDGSVVVAAVPAGDEDAIDVVETVIEAGRGEEDRYADENDAFAALTDALSGDVRFGRTHEETEETDAEAGEFAGEVARGLSASFDGETTTLTLALAFADEGDVATDDIETWTGADAFGEWDERSVSGDGRVATVTASIGTDAFKPSIPSTTAVEYLEWVPEPEVFDENHLSPYRIVPGEIANHQGTIGGSLYNALRGTLPQPAQQIGIGFEDADEIVLFSPATVVRTGTGKSEMASKLKEAGYSKDSTYAGYEVYVAGGSLAVAVSENVMVTVRAGSPIENLKAIVDAKRGETTRYVEADERVAELAGAVGGGHFAGVQRWDPIEPGNESPRNARFEGSIGLANAYTFGSETTDVAASYGFETSSDVDATAVESYLDREGTVFTTSLDSYTTTEQQRRVDVTGSTDTSDVGY